MERLARPFKEKKFKSNRHDGYAMLFSIPMFLFYSCKVRS